MSAPVTAPVGEWISPITSQSIVSQSIRLGSPRLAADGFVYWNEGRPTEGGRQVLVRRRGDKVEDVTPDQSSGFNVRTRVHEYGGGEYVIGQSAVYFSNFKDQRLYSQSLGDSIGAPVPLTPADSGFRFADAVVDESRGRLVAVREDHSQPGEAVNTVCSVDLKTGESTVLVGGNDFYAAPRLSPDGRQLAWITWMHPSMPWDDTEVWVADVAPDGSLGSSRKVAGGKDESVGQPVWSDDGHLYFISDSSGWWNIYFEASPGEIKAVLPKEAEFADPAWVFGIRSYQRLPEGKLLVTFSDPKAAGNTLVVLDPSTQSLTPLSSDFYSFGSISVAEVDDKLVIGVLGSTPLRPSVVATLTVKSVAELAAAKPQDWSILQKASEDEVDEGYLSQPQLVEFPTEGGLTAFANFYPPANKKFRLPDGSAPPLLIKIHGGPTSQASSAFNLGIQYWTSRGYAICDVNYGGSSGYGRSFRNRLRGSWGVVDVDDCCNAAKFLASQGSADPQRLCISGGSAGGYTTLACLAFRDVFKAGASHYGVADLELLAKETHKFESRYLDSLIGAYPADKAIYVERSPIHALDKFDTPIAFFQGLEDEVVPPNQAEIMYNAIKEKGITTALVLFEGEQHGFRSAPAIRRALDGEFYFYGKALGFNATMPDDLESINVVNV